MSSSGPISPSDPALPEVQHFSVARAEDPVWTLPDVVVIGLCLYLFPIVLEMLSLLILMKIRGLSSTQATGLVESAFILVPAQTAGYLLLVAFMVWMVRMRSRETIFWDERKGMPIPQMSQLRAPDFLTAIRWNMPRSSRAFAALAGGFGLAIGSEIFSWLLQKWIPKTLPIDELFRDRASAYLLALFGILVAPFVEELFFRGFLFPALARRIGSAASILITAAAFAVIHQGQLAHAWVPLGWLFIVGIVLTAVRARTKSVATSVLIHIGYNATIFTLLFFATQGFRHMERA